MSVGRSTAGGGVEVREYLRLLWCELLRLDDVQPQDDFFARGGNSMLVIRMLVAVSSHVGREIDYDRFLAEPTIATLTDLIVGSDPG